MGEGFFIIIIYLFFVFGCLLLLKKDFEGLIDVFPL